MYCMGENGGKKVTHIRQIPEFYRNKARLKPEKQKRERNGTAATKMHAALQKEQARSHKRTRHTNAMPKNDGNVNQEMLRLLAQSV